MQLHLRSILSLSGSMPDLRTADLPSELISDIIEWHLADATVNSAAALATLARVNKTWNQAYTSRLYRSVTLQGALSTRLFLRTFETSRDRTPHRCLEELRILDSMPKTLEPHELVYPRHRISNPVSADVVNEIVPSCIYLRSLLLRGRFIKYLGDFFEKAEFQQLTLDAGSQDQYMDEDLLLSIPFTVEDLTLRHLAVPETNSRFRLSRLRKLDLHFPDPQFFHCAASFSNCTKITDLTLRDVFRLSDAIELLSSIGSQIKRLSIETSDVSVDEILRMTPMVEHLVLEGDMPFNDRGISLKELRSWRWINMQVHEESSDVFNFLAGPDGCPHLENVPPFTYLYYTDVSESLQAKVALALHKLLKRGLILPSSSEHWNSVWQFASASQG